MVTQSVLAKTRLPDYSSVEPLPDPPRVPDMMEQVPAVFTFLDCLSVWFDDREDVFVGSLGYLWLAPDSMDGPYPDGTFADGLDDPDSLLKRNGYVISEVGKPPDLAYEVGSRSTGRQDYTSKRETYAEYGVREYWRFDPSGGQYHDAPLAGDRLVDGKYEPIEIVRESDGRHWGYSEVLGLEFWWDEGLLRFRDPVSGEFLRSHKETTAAFESERSARESERERAESAEQRAEGERAARAKAERERESAEARIAELEAELRRRDE